MTRSDQLLRTREARGLVWSITAHLVVAASVVAASLLHLIGVVARGVFAETDSEATFMACVFAMGALLGMLALRRAQAQRHLDAIGIGMALIDVGMIAMMPVMWHQTTASPHVSPAFLMKNELLTLSIALLIINTLSLRARYPIIVTVGAVAVHVGVAVFALSDPRVQSTNSFIVHFTGPEVNIGLFHARTAAMGLFGGTLAFIAHSARQAIKQGVDLELANLEIRQQQAQLIMEGKMVAMGALVAGVAHEINTPLGAVKSSLDNAARGAGKLQDAMSKPDPARVQKLVGVMDDSSRVGAEAIERIQHLVNSLKSFANIDEAEVQQIRLGDALDDTLTLIDATLKSGVEVEKQYGDVPPVTCRPRELNQVFMTLVVNAFEALAGGGTLTLGIGAEQDRVVVSIGDSGPGMDSEQLAGLFDIGFATKQSRVGMGLGLPSARRAVEAQGGSLEVQSAPGKGTTFRISLPLQAAP